MMSVEDDGHILLTPEQRLRLHELNKQSSGLLHGSPTLPIDCKVDRSKQGILESPTTPTYPSLQREQVLGVF